MSRPGLIALHSTPHHSKLFFNQFQGLTLSTPSLVFIKVNRALNAEREAGAAKKRAQHQEDSSNTELGPPSFDSDDSLSETLPIQPPPQPQNTTVHETLGPMRPFSRAGPSAAPNAPSQKPKCPQCGKGSLYFLHTYKSSYCFIH